MTKKIRTRGSFYSAICFCVQGTPTTASRSPSLNEGGVLPVYISLAFVVSAVAFSVSSVFGFVSWS